ncbi:hypothetical protein MKX01_030500 [Papaver californicum]|nr:hypothetical protein MKX01_030500 [Papaver californicum]
MKAQWPPKVLAVEDKLMILGCKDLAKRIVEVEMDLTLARSQGYLKCCSQQNVSGQKKLLAVIGVYTGFGSRLRRNVFRGSWMPKGDALRKLEEKGVVIRFVIGRSANQGDSLDRNIDEENRKMKDFLILDGHEEAQEEFPKKAKFFFRQLLKFGRSRDQSGAYIGCMKSGDVINELGKSWYEPEWWKFGDEKSYFRHAAGPLIILTKNLAQYININSASLPTYAHDDISVGSWTMSIQATYIDDNRFCCSSYKQDKVCSLA